MPEMTEGKIWYFVNHLSGRRQGPVDTRHLRWAIEHGELVQSSLVWCRGQPDWVQAVDALPRELFDIELPPPLPTERVNAEVASQGTEPVESIRSNIQTDTNSDDLLFGYTGPHQQRTTPSVGSSASPGKPDLSRRRRLAEVVLMTALYGSVPAFWLLGAYAYFNPDAFPSAKVKGPLIWPVVIFATLLAIGIIAVIRHNQSVSVAPPVTTPSVALSSQKRTRGIANKVIWTIGAVVGFAVLVSVLASAAPSLSNWYVEPDEYEAGQACVSAYREKYPSVDLDAYELDKPSIHSMRWQSTEDENLFSAMKCVIIRQKGFNSFVGSCDPEGPSPSPGANVLACATFDHPTRGWVVAGPANPS